MEIIIHLLFFVIGYYVATFTFARHIKKVIKKIADEHGIDLNEADNIPTANKVPVLITEMVDNNFLLYDQKNNFLCQGNTLDEVAENLLKYKNIKLAMILHENNKFWFVEGKIKKV